MSASRVLSRHRPRLVVVASSVGWQHALLSKFPPEKRPAVLAVGPKPPARGGVDEWLSDKGLLDEAPLRARLAVERAVARRQGARRTFVDYLTGLPNRRAVVRALIREAQRARRSDGRLSLVLLDLDGFKAVNEKQGHLEGDRLLRRVGSALRRMTRANELCGRIGGDEFAVVIHGGLAAAQRAAYRARLALVDVGVTATAAACELGTAERLRDLYRRCDLHLRERKEERRHAPHLPHPPLLMPPVVVKRPHVSARTVRAPSPPANGVSPRWG